MVLANQVHSIRQLTFISPYTQKKIYFNDGINKNSSKALHIIYLQDLKIKYILSVCSDQILIANDKKPNF